MTKWQKDKQNDTQIMTKWQKDKKNDTKIMTKWQRQAEWHSYNDKMTEYNVFTQKWPNAIPQTFTRARRAIKKLTTDKDSSLFNTQFTCMLNNNVFFTFTSVKERATENVFQYRKPLKSIFQQKLYFQSTKFIFE